MILESPSATNIYETSAYYSIGIYFRSIYCVAATLDVLLSMRCLMFSDPTKLSKSV